jgi:hypothetical protein
MMHFSCDVCGKDIRAGEDQRYVIKIEAFAAEDPAELTEADLEDDHLAEVSELLQELEDADEEMELPAASKQFRYDLCCDCHKRFVRDPLSKEHQHKLYFSKN